MGTMTKAQAFAEARRRWGPSGDIREDPTSDTPYRVGTTSPLVGFYVRGWGTTWEGAFRDASRVEQDLTEKEHTT